MTRRPNILVFVTDDHARWALPAYGGVAFDTPVLNALGARGTVFDNAYTPCPVCSPARASLLTGLMPSQHGVRDFIAAAPEFHEQDWLAGFDTLPEQLARIGYRCGLSGKWHLGRDETPARGFSFWLAMSGAYPVHHGGTQELSRDGVLHTHHGFLTEAITRGALDFLNSQPDDQPFFLLVGYYATHSPWQGQPQALVDAARQAPWLPHADDTVPAGFHLLNIERPPQGQEAEAVLNYRAAVADIDAGIGRILEAITGDTLTVYTADHGLALGQQGIWGKGNATRPPNLFDTSVRIPMILSQPGKIAAGAREGRCFDHCDFYATLRTAAGLTAPETDGLPRPGRPLGAPKAVQVCEYGDAARIIGPGASGERRPDMDTTGRLGPALTAFYDDLDCPPPWDWQPPAAPRFNRTEAWTPQTTRPTTRLA